MDLNMIANYVVLPIFIGVCGFVALIGLLKWGVWLLFTLFASFVGWLFLTMLGGGAAAAYKLSDLF